MSEEQKAPRERARKRRSRRVIELPEGVKDNGDYTYTVEFGHPVKVAGEAVESLRMRMCKAADSIVVEELLGEADMEERTYAMIAQLCDLPPDGLDDLTFADFSKLTALHEALNTGNDPESQWLSGDENTALTVRLEYGPNGTAEEGDLVLTLKPITVGQRRKAAKLKSPAMQEVRLLAVSANVDDDFIKNLFLWDYQRVSEALSRFLPRA